MMKLYYAPGFSSLADHIALLEAGLAHELVRVNIGTKQIETGRSYLRSQPEGLRAGAGARGWRAADGERRHPRVDRGSRAGAGASRLLGPLSVEMRMLSFIATEIHKRFPLYLTLPKRRSPCCAEQIAQWLGHVAGRLTGDYLFGNAFSAADAYLFVMARGAAELAGLPAPLPEYVARIEARPSVREALRRETENR